MVGDETVRETDLYVGEITDDFGYRWNFVKPRATELREHFTLSTMYQGQPIYGWVKKFPNWEDRRKEVQSYVSNHEARAGVESIHTIWSMRTLISKYGPEATIRELKKRCDAGAIVGCSMYLNFSLHLIEVALDNKDPAWQAVPFAFMESAEGDRWVKRLEEIHKKYPDRRIPKNVIGDIKDEFREDIERRVGRLIPRLPGDATKQDIMFSKKIAEQLSRGTFIKKPPEEKPRPPPVAAPTIPMPVEKMPETKPELELMKKEIEERIKEEKRRRARGGGGTAGESGSGYLEAGEKKEAKYPKKQDDYERRARALFELTLRTFIKTTGITPSEQQRKELEDRVESLNRYKGMTENEFENAIYTSSTLDEIEDIGLAIFLSDVPSDRKNILMEKAKERRFIFRGKSVAEKREPGEMNLRRVMWESAAGEPAGRYSAGDDRIKVKYLEDILVKTFITTQGRNPTIEEMQVIKQRTESLIRKYGTYTYKGLENAIYASLSIEDLGNMMLAIHASNLAFDDKKKLVEKIGERMRIFKGGLVEDADESRPGNGFQVLTTLPGGVTNWEKTQKLVERLKRMGITVDVEPQYFTSYQARYSGDAPEFIVRSILKVPPEQVDKANYFMTDFMKSAGFEVKEDQSDYRLREVERKLSKLPEEERKKIIQEIWISLGKPMEPGKVITLDIIAGLSKEERIKIARILMGPEEKKKEVISPYTAWTFEDFKTIINRITNLEDLLELEKHISESKVTTPRQRIQLMQLVAQRETEIRKGGPELRKQIEEQQREQMAASVQRLRENKGSDMYSRWTYDDFNAILNRTTNIEDLMDLAEHIEESRMTPGEKVSARLLVKKRKKDIVYGTPEIKRLIDEQQMMGRLAGASRLRDQDDIKKDLTSLSYAELHFLISTWDQGFDKLKKLHGQIDTFTGITDLDKEILKDEISKRMQDIEVAVELGKDVGLHLSAGKERILKYHPNDKKDDDEVHEDADEPVEPRDYTQWTFSDFEGFIPSLDIDELEELYEYVGASDKVTEPEGDMLRDMIDKRIEKLRGA